MAWLDVVIIFLLAASTLVQLVFWEGIFSRLGKYRLKEEEYTLPEEELPGVSLVICARNEAENLVRNLPHFLSESYRFLEVIVVNDSSEDKTASVLLEFLQKNPKLRVINVGHKNTNGKKAALTRGIEAASQEVILLTDADCIPAGAHWVLKMASGLCRKTDIILGYSPYLQSRSFLNHLIRFETSYTATQYLSFALAGYPYMGVGRNLMYRKHLFYQHGGFEHHKHLASGDDDLFINQAARSSNTRVVLHPQAFTYSIPKSNWRDYYYQKRRHLTAGRHYRFRHQFLLGALAFSHFTHYAAAAAILILSPALWMSAFIAYAVRIMVVFRHYRRILRLLRDPELLPWVPLMDAVYVLYYLVFAPVFFNTGQSRQETWKQ